MKLIKLKCLILALLMLIIPACSELSKDKDLKSRFNQAYNGWKKYIKEFNQKKMPIDHLIYNKYYAKIILLGVPVLPLIVKKLRKGECLLNHAFLKISKLKEREMELFYLYAYKDTKTTTLLILRWWDYKRIKIKDRFKKRYNRFLNSLNKSSYKLFSSNPRHSVLPLEYDDLLTMGVFILPYIIQELRAVVSVKGFIDNQKAAILSQIVMKLVNKNSLEMKKEIKTKQQFYFDYDVPLVWWKKYKDKWIIKEAKTNN